MPRCQQNGCRCARGAASNTSVNSAVTNTLTDPAFVEDMPMCRYTNPIPICGGGGTGNLDAEILAALQCQNQILVDILGAINSLTVAALSGKGCFCLPKDRIEQ